MRTWLQYHKFRGVPDQESATTHQPCDGDRYLGHRFWQVDEYPEADVRDTTGSYSRWTGMLRPDLVRPNVKFLVDGIESERAYEDNPFVLIHARNPLCLTKREQPSWVECQDNDGYPYSEVGNLDGTALQKYYYDEAYSAFEEADYEIRPGPKLEQWFKDASFVNIHKNLGAWNQPQAEVAGFEGFTLAALARHKQWTKEEVISLASQVRADGRKRTISPDGRLLLIYSQRPENSQSEIRDGQSMYYNY
ncbi:hypothetical protein VTN31DRAFT_7331 [Thermomyces dupontii]|uniref:uncharacterized protein n=1 Tax=Talaromyces thermophilus TaxID=28565 RepID=UPI003743DE29